MTEDRSETMSGRRLADLLALASATRNVVKRSVNIQLQSVSRAAVTSSITKAIKRDFRGAPSVVYSATNPSTSAPSENESALLDGKDQDVFYDPSESHSSPANTGTDELKVRQSEDSINVNSAPITKESKPTSASRSKSSKPTHPIKDRHVRKMSTHRPLPSETADDTNESSCLRKNIDEEIYYGTEASTKSNKGFEPNHIPQEAAQPPAPHDKLHDGINSEYYYDAEADPDEKKPKSVYPSHMQPNVQRYKMSPSKVPSSQIGRLFHYGGLAAGIGLGVLNETLRRATSSSESSPQSLMFSAANMERLVRKLSRMRGAALKLGQMISIQGMHSFSNTELVQ
jgi:aarF domain-containing kinase